MSVTTLIGDCRESMRTLPEKSAHCCVTSPPYFGLRNYLHDGQIGLEKTPAQYIATIVEVFREVRRVLRDDGTVWLNLGDSYARMGSDSYATGKNAKVANQINKRCKRMSKPPDGFKHKDLIGIPWRVAFALQSDGWYLRQDIIWHKPNSMPESVTDRCTKAHEYMFLLSKSARYYYDAEAVKEPLAEASVGRAQRKQKLMGRTGKGTIGKQIENGVDTTHAYAGLALGRNGKTGYDLEAGTRNKRSVWTVSTKAYKGAHFAVFPPDLIEPCILAGCPEQGTVLDPFGGSGTTAGVAIRNRRKAILCELNADYAALMPERVAAIIGNVAEINQELLFQ